MQVAARRISLAQLFVGSRRVLIAPLGKRPFAFLVDALKLRAVAVAAAPAAVGPDFVRP